MLPKSMTLLLAVSAIFVGVVLLLGNMGIISNQVMALWPIILVIAGLVGLTCMGDKKIEVTSRTSSSKKKKK